ncbi:MAG: YigZ family protein [Xanthomonadales bacterium]|nr:YigZ family protein [Xanthomonadales bacterium]
MLTIARPASVDSEIRRSRFVAHAARVDDLAATRAFYAAVADPAATHNCWAWRLDHQYRFHDDGEPASTAGKPILAAIEGKQLDHVMVVVTRYFGGVKLGAGGLIRAYGGSAAKCLDRAGSREIVRRLNCFIRAGFEWTGEVYAALESCGARKLSESFAEQGVMIEAEVPESRLACLRRSLRDATRGKVTVRLCD